VGRSPFPHIKLYYTVAAILFFLDLSANAAWAADSLAIGTRYGEQET